MSGGVRSDGDLRLAATGRNYYGVEQNPERRAVAIQKIKAHTPDSTKAA